MAAVSITFQHLYFDGWTLPLIINWYYSSGLKNLFELKGGLNPFATILLTLQNVVSKHADNNSTIVKNHSNVKLGVLLTDYTVAILTNYVKTTDLNLFANA